MWPALLAAELPSSLRQGGPQSGPRRPGPGLLATSGRHRPGRPATLGDDQDLEDLGAPPRTPALLRDAAADHLARHHKGWTVWRLPDEEIRLNQSGHIATWPDRPKRCRRTPPQR